jgi:hypothetical protein
VTRRARTASAGLLELRTRLVRAGLLAEKQPLSPEQMAMLQAIAAMIEHALSEN